MKVGWGLQGDGTAAVLGSRLCGSMGFEGYLGHAGRILSRPTTSCQEPAWMHAAETNPPLTSSPAQSLPPPPPAGKSLHGYTQLGTTPIPLELLTCSVSATATASW